MTEIKFNINDYVKVKLTEHGKRVIAERNEKFRKVLPKYPGRAVEEDSDGYSKWQLWDLMQIFGSEIGLCRGLPFETEIIFIAKEQQQ